MTSIRKIVIKIIFLSIIIMPLDPVLQFPIVFFFVRLSVSKVLVLLSIMLLFFMFFVNSLKYKFNKKVFLVFYIWIIYYLTTGLWSYGRLENILRNVLLIFFVSFIIILTYVLEKENLGRKAISYIMFISILFALIEQFLGIRLPASRQHLFVYELTSFYINPAHLGASISLAFPWSLEKETYGLKNNFFYILFLFISAIFVILRTGVKGAIFSFIISFLFLIMSVLFKRGIKSFFYTFRNYFLAFFIVFIVSIYYINIYLPPLIREKLSYVVPQLLFESESYVSRKNIWENLWYYILKDPVHLIIGYGIGSFNYLFDFSSHNLFFELLIEGGIINVLLFVFMVLYIVFKLYMKNFDRNKISIVSLVSSIPLYFTLGSFLDFWIFWIILGVCFARI